MFEIYAPLQMSNKIQKKQFYNPYISLHDIEPIMETLRKIGSGLFLCQDEEIGFVCPYVITFDDHKKYLFGKSKTFITVFKNDFVLELFNDLCSIVGSLRVIEDTHSVSVKMSDNKTTITMGNINTVTLIDDNDSMTILDLVDIIDNVLENISEESIEIFDKNERFFAEEFGFILTSDIDEQKVSWEKLINNEIILNYDFEFINI